MADTKLKRKPAPGHVLQLVLYSDLVTQIQDLAPEYAHVVLGNRERFSFRLAEYAAYARGARERLEKFVIDPPTTRPIPCSTCDLCRWREHCSGIWREEDSLFEVAGITKVQVAKLEAEGISTLQALSEFGGPVRHMATETLGKLNAQSRLQQDRKSGSPSYELRTRQPGKGFDLLPRPIAVICFMTLRETHTTKRMGPMAWNTCTGSGTERNSLHFGPMIGWRKDRR